jgi:hypothetical protein
MTVLRKRALPNMRSVYLPTQNKFSAAWLDSISLYVSTADSGVSFNTFTTLPGSGEMIQASLLNPPV